MHPSSSNFHLQTCKYHKVVMEGGLPRAVPPPHILMTLRPELHSVQMLLDRADQRIPFTPERPTPAQRPCLSPHAFKMVSKMIQSAHHFTRCYSLWVSIAQSCEFALMYCVWRAADTARCPQFISPAAGKTGLLAKYMFSKGHSRLQLQQHVNIPTCLWVKRMISIQYQCPASLLSLKANARSSSTGIL